MRTNRPRRAPELIASARAIAAALVVAAGCDGEIRPPKTRPTGEGTPATPAPPSAPTGQPGAGGPAEAPAAPGAGEENERLIGGLSSRELMDLCRSSHANIARALAAQVEIDCIATSLGESASGCASARDACMKENLPEAEGSDDAACEEEAPTLAQDCAVVSVSALRACEEAWIRKLEGAAEQLDCESSLEEARALNDPAVPGECQNFDARCSAP